MPDRAVNIRADSDLVEWVQTCAATRGEDLSKATREFWRWYARQPGTDSAREMLERMQR